MLARTKTYIITHKFISIFLLLAVCYGGYKEYVALNSTAGETRYILGVAQKQTIIASLTGSGQVSTVNQIDLKPKALGDIMYLGVDEGQEVKVGALIAQLDTRDAEKAVRDAEVNLESAKLSLLKLEKPADVLSTIQSENTLARGQESKIAAEANLLKSYDTGFNSVSNTFLDLPNVMASLSDILFGNATGLDSTTQNIDYYTRVSRLYDFNKAELYNKDAYDKYQIARNAYDVNFGTYKATSRLSGTSTVEDLISQTYVTTRSVAEAVKSATNLIQFYKDKLTERNLHYAALADTHLTTLNSYTSQTNGHLVDLLSVTDSITSSKNALVDADRTIRENTESLTKLKVGADALDIESLRLVVTQRENALLDAKEKLADYYVYAPFGGTIAKLNSKKGDPVSTATVIATLMTKQKVAEISLNEVDAAKVKVGQKASLTFDAIDGLIIAAKVVQIDTIGTVSQGVVSYTVKLSFDTQDERIKSGMSVSAAIITNMKANVLAIPSSAVKSRGGAQYVQILDAPVVATVTSMVQGITSATAPREKNIEVGLTNDTVTEVTSGLIEGEQVITRTITSTTATTATAPSLFGRGGGGIRIPHN